MTPRRNGRCLRFSACSTARFGHIARGVSDRSAQVLPGNLTYPGRYLFTQTNPYPSVAILPELVFGAIIGPVDLIDCVPLEKVEGQPYANGPWLLDSGQSGAVTQARAPRWQARPVRGA
jgi:hypothetical protein